MATDDRDPSRRKGKTRYTRPRAKSPPINREMAAKIKVLLRDTDLAQHEIAAMLGINQGRVSEVNTGRRHPDVQPGG